MKTSQKRLALLLLASVIGAVVGTSCNTFRGFGRDVQHTGNHIENAAKH